MTITHPDRIHDTFAEAVNSKDVRALMALYDADGIAVELDGSQATGYDAILAMSQGLTDAIRHIDAATRKVVLADGIALSSAAWTAEMVLPDGTVVVQRGITAEVSRRQPDGTWRVVIDDPLFV